MHIWEMKEKNKKGIANKLQSKTILRCKKSKRNKMKKNMYVKTKRFQMKIRRR